MNVQICLIIDAPLDLDRLVGTGNAGNEPEIYVIEIST
jgi:hypothetical protein